ncbi:MAG TPA: sulfatase-like hydrolase/transferase [Candidatus Binataceae bacterium]|nr:sulfatase-like hydrolase/transferase [Candidatus Binataceae bacterium]
MPGKPNFLLILADDMGYGDFGCFNYGISRTPTLDQLVRGGLCLTQHYSASPVCAPARASLITGRYPHRTGVLDTLEMRGLDRLALRERTLAELLKPAGYVTGLVGKWHNGALDARYHPNRRGFDEFAGFCGGWAPYWNWRIDRNGSIGSSDGRYLTDVFTEEAADFIRRHRSESFFLYLAYNAPHFPFEAPDDAIKPYRETGSFTAAVSAIYAMIEIMDRGIARLLDLLGELGLAENTLVMFSSDNGPQFGGQGEMCTDRFNCGFAGAKTLVYEGGIRLPMVMRWPAGLGPARQVHNMIHFTDWLPTILSIAGADTPRDRKLDGIDVRPVLSGDSGKAPGERFWQWNRYSPDGECNAAMRDGRWKLVRPAMRELMRVSQADLAMDFDSKYHPDRYPDIVREPEPERTRPAPPPAQLFDIVNDPFERVDLAARESDRVARMTNQLMDWFTDVERERKTIAE